MTEEVQTRGYLLDTNTAIFSLWHSKSLSVTAKAAVAEGPNFLSVVCYWEVVAKSMKGKLDVGDPRLWWLEALGELAATPLALRPEHVGAVNELPPIHQDPFDRMMIAQATVERLALVTSDSEVLRYAATGLHVVG